MSAREEMLDRVRRAAAVRPVDVVVRRGYRQADDDPWDTAKLVDVLVDRLVDYKAGVVRCDEAGVAGAITDVLRRHAAPDAVVPVGFPDAWLPGDVGIVRDLPPLTAPQLDAVASVVTTSAVAIAETGTIVLDSGPGMGRRALTLVPDLHVVVVRETDIVRGVPEALLRLDPRLPLTWISGPSATSDIELNRVEGVHGPRRLEVVVAR
jgi:L-lactate dehydrogenase complex protein LldG